MPLFANAVVFRLYNDQIFSDSFTSLFCVSGRVYSKCRKPSTGRSRVNQDNLRLGTHGGPRTHLLYTSWFCGSMETKQGPRGDHPGEEAL